MKADLTIKNDLDDIYRYELEGMFGDQAKLRKRLLRHFETGVNWDESKEFLFKWINPPPPYYHKKTNEVF